MATTAQIYPLPFFPVHSVPMSLNDHTTQEKLTPEERRELLRAFADRMLMKITAMDDPEDMPGVEKAVRVAAVIERLYSRCDRAEHHAPHPRKLEAERASHEEEAIKARVSLANTLKWSDERRQGLGQWWDAARTVTQDQTRTPATVQASNQAALQRPSATPAPQGAAAPNCPGKAEVTYTDYTDCILKAQADLRLKKISAAAFEGPAKKPPPPS